MQWCKETSSPQGECLTAGDGVKGIGCAGKKQALQDVEIEPSTAPRTLVSDGCTTPPAKMKQYVKTLKILE